jgi:hypothetical protein
VKDHAHPLPSHTGKKGVGVFSVVTEDKIAFAEGATAHALQGIDTAGITFNNGKKLLIIRAGRSKCIHSGTCQTETYRQAGTGMAMKPYDISIFQDCFLSRLPEWCKRPDILTCTSPAGIVNVVKRSVHDL